MNLPNFSPALADRMLRSAQTSGSHGHLVNVCEILRPAISKTRPLSILCPHADDGAITSGCLLHDFAVRRGLPVVEVLMFGGERNVAAPWMDTKIRISIREDEFRLECKVLGTEPACWNLDAYRVAGYQPTPGDIEKITSWFQTQTPGAIIVPPMTDAHQAHRMTRVFAAIGIIASGVKDVVVMSGWTPWGPLAQPNAYFTYDGESERTREWALRCHASQIQLTDYTIFCANLGRAYAALVREWEHGHTITGRGHERVEQQFFVGAELYQVEKYNPQLVGHDPMHIALGVMEGKIDPKEFDPS